jgi:putative salt-induced outer membrane protein
MRSQNFLAVLVVAALPATGFAADPAPAPPPPIWSGQASLSFVSTSGNSSTQTLGAGAEIDYNKDVWAGLARAAYLRAEATDQTTKMETVNAESSAATLRGARKLQPKLEAFVQGDFVRDTFSGIDHRLTGEAGVGYSVVDTAPQALKLTVGLGYTKESRSAGESLSFSSAIAGLGYKWKFSKTAEFAEDVAYTEDLKDTGDWRLSNVTSLTAGLTTVLSLKATYTLNYLKEPVAGFGSTDTVTAVALVAKF